ncbi:MAG: ABC transporter permease [Clostridia bacterium]|nr:ABC transporter permease [Clostridia bacterium]
MKFFVTPFLIQKRLLKKPSFIIIILLIPLTVLSIMTISKKDTGMLTVGVYASEKCDEAVNSSVKSIMTNNNFIRIKKYDDEKAIMNDINYGKLDCAWIFPDDLKIRIKDYLNDAGYDKNLVTVIQKDDSVPAMLSREMLFGSVFPSVSRQIFKDYIENDLNLTRSFTENELNKIYDGIYFEQDLVKFTNSNGKVMENPNFLVSPVRGILSIFIMVCSLASAMYYLNDYQNGVFSTMPLKKQLSILFYSTFFGAFDCGIISVISLSFTPLFTNLGEEILSMLLFVLAISAFSAFFATIINKPHILGTFIVFVSLIVFILCPVFFNLEIKYIPNAFPQQFYLLSVGNLQMIPKQIYLFLCYGLLTTGIFFLKSKNKKA